MTDNPLSLYRHHRWRTVVPVLLAALCFLLAGGAIAYKYIHLGYRTVQIEEQATWNVRLVMDVEGAGQKLTVSAMPPLPVSARQTILDLEVIGEGFTIAREDPFMVWQHPGLDGSARLVMSYRARTQARKYSLPSVLDWSELESSGLETYLADTERTQVEHPDIRAKGELLASESDDVIAFIRNLFDYVQDEVVYAKVGGPTDAVTAYRLGEASCNGKNRLFVALARSQSLPARLVKGLILEKGVIKSESHAWSELFINGQWIPFCPTNRHFAEIPATYLEYPKVDARMFRYTKNVKFDRAFHLNYGARSPEEALKRDLDNPHHVLRAWGSLGEAQFSLSLLMVILTIPIGATVVAFLRNIVGVVPFGTFLPALIAVSFRETGLLWGGLMFSTTILLGVGLNEVLRRFHLLHFPRLSIVMTFSVCCVLGLAVIAIHYGQPAAAKVGMFPLAILTLTVERFSLAEEEGSFRDAFLRLLITLASASLCYAVMMDFRVRSAVLVFPEVLLVCVGINLLLGVYTGLRWTEYVRFRLLHRSEAGPP